MDFKNLAVVLVFNIITQAIPIGLAIYLAIRLATKTSKEIVYDEQSFRKKGI